MPEFHLWATECDHKENPHKQQAHLTVELLSFVSITGYQNHFPHYLGFFFSFSNETVKIATRFLFSVMQFKEKTC